MTAAASMIDDRARFEQVIDDLAKNLDEVSTEDWRGFIAAAYDPTDVLFALAYLGKRGIDPSYAWRDLVRLVGDKVKARIEREEDEGCIVEAAERLDDEGISEPTLNDVLRTLPRRAHISPKEALPRIRETLRSWGEAANA